MATVGNHVRSAKLLGSFSFISADMPRLAGLTPIRNMNFGDYIRKLRIDKATGLMESTDYSLTEIAYLTGFSDQSHFTRIFKQHTGMVPSAYKKNLLKSKLLTKGK